MEAEAAQRERLSDLGLRCVRPLSWLLRRLCATCRCKLLLLVTCRARASATLLAPLAVQRRAMMRLAAQRWQRAWRIRLAASAPGRQRL
jgi:hypothetical protein